MSAVLPHVKLLDGIFTWLYASFSSLLLPTNMEELTKNRFHLPCPFPAGNKLCRGQSSAFALSTVTIQAALSSTIAELQWIIRFQSLPFQKSCALSWHLDQGFVTMFPVKRETTRYLPCFGLTDKAVPGLELPANCHWASAGTQKHGLYERCLCRAPWQHRIHAQMNTRRVGCPMLYFYC